MKQLVHYEKRWALVAIHEGDRFLLGRYAWADETTDEPHVRTFETRAQARDARKQLRSYRTAARVVAVDVTIRELEGTAPF